MTEELIAQGARLWLCVAVPEWLGPQSRTLCGLFSETYSLSTGRILQKSLPRDCLFRYMQRGEKVQLFGCASGDGNDAVRFFPSA
jgi:hypothetical protein